MKDSITIFSSQQFGKIRTAGTSDEPLFCVSDVCHALGIKQAPTKILAIGSNHRQSIGMQKLVVPSPRGKVAAIFVNEAGLYKCIFRSRKKEAEAFQEWVFGEVLPAIRKQGGYMVTKPEETPEEIMARALQIANSTLQQREQRIAQLSQQTEQQQVTIIEQEETINQQAQEIAHKDEVIQEQSTRINENASKVEYYDRVMDATTTLTTSQVANQFGRSAQALNGWLIKIGLIYKQGKEYLVRCPYSSWGLHSCRIFNYTTSEGFSDSRTQTVWTQRGVRFIHELVKYGNIKDAAHAIGISSVKAVF